MLSKVLTVEYQPLVQLAAEQRNAVGFSLMTEPVEVQAELPAAAWEQHLPVQVRPVFRRQLTGETWLGKRASAHEPYLPVGRRNLAAQP
jgi:hypothetical protein